MCHSLIVSSRSCAGCRPAPTPAPVFADLTGKPLHRQHAMLHVMQALRPGLTVHGLRSSFKDWASETTHHPNHVIEMALAHAVGNAVEAAYRRGDLFEKSDAADARLGAPTCSPKINERPPDRGRIEQKSGAEKQARRRSQCDKGNEEKKDEPAMRTPRRTTAARTSQVGMVLFAIATAVAAVAFAILSNGA